MHSALYMYIAAHLLVKFKSVPKLSIVSTILQNCMVCFFEKKTSHRFLRCYRSCRRWPAGQEVDKLTSLYEVYKNAINNNANTSWSQNKFEWMNERKQNQRWLSESEGWSVMNLWPSYTTELRCQDQPSNRAHFGLVEPGSLLINDQSLTWKKL